MHQRESARATSKAEAPVSIASAESVAQLRKATAGYWIGGSAGARVIDPASLFGGAETFGWPTSTSWIVSTHSLVSGGFVEAHFTVVFFD